MNNIIDLTDDNDIIEIIPNKIIKSNILTISNNSKIKISPIDCNNKDIKINISKSASTNSNNSNNSILWNIGRKRRHENNINNIENIIEPSLIDKPINDIEDEKIDFVSNTIYNNEIRELYNAIMSDSFIDVNNLNRDDIYIKSDNRFEAKINSYIMGKKYYNTFWGKTDLLNINKYIVVFIPDPANKFDKNAIKIHIFDESFSPIGYLPGLLAKAFSPLIINCNNNFFAVGSFNINNEILETGLDSIKLNIFYTFPVEPLPSDYVPFSIALAASKLPTFTIYQSQEFLQQILLPDNSKIPILSSILYLTDGSSSIKRQLNDFLSKFDIVLNRYNIFFTEIEKSRIIDFRNNLSESTRILLYRLQNRKVEWINVEQLKYPELNVKDAIKDLNLKKYVLNLKDLCSSNNNIDSIFNSSFEVISDLNAYKAEFLCSLIRSLPLATMKKVAQTIGVDKKFINYKKDNLVKAVTNHIKIQKTIVGTPLFLSKSFSNNLTTICGEWIRVEPIWLQLIKLMGYLSSYSWNNTSSFVMQEQGRVSYFTYKITFSESFFSSRLHIEEYVKAKELLSKVHGIVDSELFDDAKAAMEQSFKNLNLNMLESADFFKIKPPSIDSLFADNLYPTLVDFLLKSNDILDNNPFFLTKIEYSPFYIYIECIYQLLKVYEKNGEFELACKISYFLLNLPYLEDDCQIIDSNRAFTSNSFVYFDNRKTITDLPTILKFHGRRGKLWYRLILNLMSHLRKPEIAYSQALIALTDSSICAGFKIATLERAYKLHNSLKLENSWAFPVVQDLMVNIPIRTFFGRPVNRVAGQKSKFFGLDDKLCSVEELILEELEVEGYTGIHTEGTIWSNLFGLFFIEALFAPVPDAFHHEAQDSPLDIYNSGFYYRRKIIIDTILDRIKSGGFISLLDYAFTFAGVRIQGVQWDLYSYDELVTICKGVGGNFLWAIFSILIKNGHWSGGLPDLLLIKNGEGTLAEVKGPRDKLSEQQKAWLLALNYLGVNVIICKVQEKSISSDD